MSLEQALADNTAALTRNSDLLERVVAGQEAAMEKLNSGSTTRKPRGAKADAAAASEPSAEDTSGNSTGGGADNASTASGEAGAAPAAEPEVVTTETTADIAAAITNEAQMKEFVTGWTGSTEDAAERAKRVELLKGIAAKLGVAPKFGELVPHAAKAVFFIERAKALGVDAVDVEAAYDFDGSPSQDAPTSGGGSDFE